MFPFIYVCDLLEALQQIQCRYPPYLPKDAEARNREAIKAWFCTHRSRIDCQADGESLISTLLPSRRTDRVYGLKESRLQKLVARALGLSRHRIVDLERWRTPGAGDIADCIERVQRQREIALPSTASQVSVEEIDGVLLEIASRCRFSSPEIRSQAKHNTTSNPDETLGALFQRLQATQSKWLIRLILKEYAPVSLPESLVNHCYHDLLPQVLNVHNHLPTAISLLNRLAAESNAGLSPSSRLEILKNLQPQIGTKIGRPPFFKGRSIKNCVVMSRGRCMSVERKMDGEYMQIHIDMSKPRSGQIKIFSKSGKESTDDRKNVHSAIRKCLRLGDADCMIQKQCILEGELLVYSDKHQKVLDFYKIRKHVNRSGSLLGIEKDSQPHSYEHPMVVFFDLLVLDERIGLNHKQRDRRQEMEKLIQLTMGRAELVQREVISFSGTSAASDLRRAFARVITSGGEGLVLKPTDEPYFSFEGKGDYSSCCIKMKKEYIGNYGSVGDFAVVAASYDPVKAKQLGVQGIKWTEFYIGCLENKDDIIRLAAKPKFVIVTTVSPNAQIVQSLHSDINLGASEYGSEKNFEIRLERGIAQGRAPTTSFKNPPIFDIRCFGFDKEGCTGFFAMRFPQVSKLHYDRTFMDAVTFLELQKMAEIATSLPVDGDEQEDVKWIEKLKAADPRGIAIDAVTQEASSPHATPSKLNSADLTTFQCHRDSYPLKTSPRTTKRSHLPAADEENSSPKRSRESPKATRIQSQGRSSATGLTTSPLKRRGVLSDITHRHQPVKESPRGDFVHYSTFEKPSSCPVNIQRQSEQQPQYSTPPDETSPARLSKSFPLLSSNTGSSKPLWDLPMAVWSDDLQLPTLSPRSAITGKCWRMAEKPCPLMRATICLSPCVSAMPLLTEDLLPAHGVQFTYDIRAWLDRSKFPRRCIATKRVIRKILLVEPKRKQPTIDFLHKVERMNIGSEEKEKEWVEVYDWRLLESIHDFERGKAVAFDIWKHHWVAAV